MKIIIFKYAETCLLCSIEVRFPCQKKRKHWTSSYTVNLVWRWTLKLTQAIPAITIQDQIIRACTGVPVRSLGTQQTNVLTPSIVAATRIGTCKSKHNYNSHVAMHTIANSSSMVIVRQIWRQVCTVKIDRLFQHRVVTLVADVNNWRRLWLWGNKD